MHVGGLVAQRGTRGPTNDAGAVEEAAPEMSLPGGRSHSPSEAAEEEVAGIGIDDDKEEEEEEEEGALTR